MSIPPWNPFPRCLAVRIYAPNNSSEEEAVVVAEVRCGLATLVDEANETIYQFGLSRAVLEIANSGCSIKPGPRQGDQKLKHKVRAKSSSKSKMSLDANIGVSATFLTPAVGGKASHATNATTDFEVEEIFSDVRSIGDRHIELVAPPGKHLSGYYLGHEDLCVVTDQADGAEITIRAFFMPKDLVLGEIEQKRFLLPRKLSRNKLAFACILIAKALHTKFKEKLFSTLIEVPIAEATLSVGLSAPSHEKTRKRQ